MMRRGAVYLAHAMIQGAGGVGGKDLLAVIKPDNLKALYVVLKREREKEKDDVARFHATQALDTLDNVLRSSLLLSLHDPQSYTLPIATLAERLGW